MRVPAPVESVTTLMAIPRGSEFLASSGVQPTEGSIGGWQTYVAIAETESSAVTTTSMLYLYEGKLTRKLTAPTIRIHLGVEFPSSQME